MPALNFKVQYVPKIEAGTKTQTIRAERKDGKVFKINDKLSLYSGMRTKYCFKIKEVVISDVKRVLITNNKNVVINPLVENIILSASDLQEFVIADGFDNEENYIGYKLVGRNGKPAINKEWVL